MCEEQLQRAAARRRVDGGSGGEESRVVVEGERVQEEEEEDEDEGSKQRRGASAVEKRERGLPSRGGKDESECEGEDEGEDAAMIDAGGLWWCCEKEAESVQAGGSALARAGQDQGNQVTVVRSHPQVAGLLCSGLLWSALLCSALLCSGLLCRAAGWLGDDNHHITRRPQIPSSSSSSSCPLPSQLLRPVLVHCIARDPANVRPRPRPRVTCPASRQHKPAGSNTTRHLVCPQSGNARWVLYWDMAWDVGAWGPCSRQSCLAGPLLSPSPLLLAL